MTSLAKLWLIACVAMLPACQGPGPVVDQRPDFLSKEHTASSVWLGTLRGTKLGTWGTAVIVGPRHLLTNAHVWSPSDSEEQPWLESELPAEQKLVLFDPAVPKHHVHKDGKDHHFTRPGFRTPTFRLVATGTPGFQDVCVDCGKLHPLNVNLHDWALIETDEPGWDPEDAVVIHPAARDPDWLRASSSSRERSRILGLPSSRLFRKVPTSCGERRVGRVGMDPNSRNPS